MNIKDLKRIEKLANNLRQTVPASHTDAFRIYQAPGEISDAIDAAIELAKLDAVKEYIESKPDGSRDTASLSKMQSQRTLYARRVEAASELEKKLVGIAIDFQIEQEARAAGAINHKLVAMCLKGKNVLEHSVDSDGNLSIFVDGLPAKDAVKALTLSQDTRILFDSDRPINKPGSSRPFDGKNPWLKETFNLTQQGIIWKQDRALGERLKAAAKAAQTV
ncbi:MAG: hypothetical protein ACOZF0_24080 [Thermodesulfobacteriota bacterium]